MKTLLLFGSVVMAVGCGGADITVVADSGGDTSPGDDGAMDTGVGTDAGADTGVVCTAPKIDCKGVCVDIATDPGNCGGCGIDCQGGSCQMGICSLLNPDAGAPPNVGDFACIAVDQQFVYVSTGLAANMGGQVYRVPVNGGSWSPVATMQANPHGIKSNGQNVFWANYGSGTIMRSDPNGNNLMQIASGQNQPFFVTLDSQYVFWINNGNGSVFRANLGGGGVQQLFAGYGANHAGMITNAGPTVFFASTGSNVVAATPKAGGTTNALAQNQQMAFGIDTDGTSLFWSNAGTGVIQKQAIVNPQAPTPIANGQQNPRGIATDGKNVYWSNAAMAGAIQKVGINGGNVTSIASNQFYPNCVAVDTTSAFWINEGSGAISKTAK